MADYQFDEYCDFNQGIPMPVNFSYNSGTNSDFLSVEKIR
jgi:hypothetical protein